MLLLPFNQNPTHICWNTQRLPDGTYCLLVSGPHRVDTGCDRGWKLVGFSAELLKNCFQLGVMVHTLSPSHTSLQSEFWDSQSYYYTEKLCLKKNKEKFLFCVLVCVCMSVPQTASDPVEGGMTGDPGPRFGSSGKQHVLTTTRQFLQLPAEPVEQVISGLKSVADRAAKQSEHPGWRILHLGLFYSKLPVWLSETELWFDFYSRTQQSGSPSWKATVEIYFSRQCAMCFLFMI